MLDKGQIRRNIKRMAIRMLKGGWGVALGVMIIPILVSCGFAALKLAVATMLGIDQALLSSGMLYAVPPARLASYSLVNLILGVAQFAISTPIAFGVTSWYVSLTDGHKAPISAAFRFLDNAQRYWKTITVTLLLTLRQILYSILFMSLPAAYLTWQIFRMGAAFPLEFYFRSGNYFQFNLNPRFFEFDLSPHFFGMQMALPTLLAVLFFLVASFALVIFLLRYLPATYLTIRNPAKPAGHILAQSVELMRGHKLEAIWFSASFLGWFTLSALLWAPISAALNLLLPWEFSLTAFPFLSGVPLLFVSTYVKASTVLFCEYVEDDARLKSGQAPYSVVEEQSAYSWNAEPRQREALPGDTTPIATLQDELWRHTPAEEGAKEHGSAAQNDTRELWQFPGSPRPFTFNDSNIDTTEEEIDHGREE